MGIVGKVEESVDSRAKWKALLLLFNKCNVLVIDGAVFCTEGKVRWEWCVALQENWNWDQNVEVYSGQSGVGPRYSWSHDAGEFAL